MSSLSVVSCLGQILLSINDLKDFKELKSRHLNDKKLQITNSYDPAPASPFLSPPAASGARRYCSRSDG